MDTTALKKFAQGARRQLLEQVSLRMEQVLRVDSVEVREKAKVVEQLKAEIEAHGKKAVVDKVAYTWFNRFCALRFMDVNHYTRIGAVSPVEGGTQPEVLLEAKQGHIDEELLPDVKKRQEIFDLLSGRRPSSDGQGEAYRLLLVGMCNAYGEWMPFLFEKIEDYSELLMPLDLLSENSVLHDLREALSAEACEDVEVIGWLYQYYISERKDEVFEALKQNQKIEAEDIPAATQLFTPHWIVRYLVENSLGRLWMLNHPNSRLRERMEYYIAPAQEETDFLRIASPEELRLLDPACGSGHILTYAFDLLYAIYEEEGYASNDIPRLILERNIFGVEIDGRAGALAAFALTMKARAKDRRFFSRDVLPQICVLENVTFNESELKQYMNAVGRDLFTEPLKETLLQFEQAENFGSLIRPLLSDAGYVRGVLAEKNVGGDLFLYGVHERVMKVLKFAEFLAPRYHVVVTNPPYMSSGGMNDDLSEYSKDFYPDSKSDTYTMFIERGLELTHPLGVTGMITIPNWMFLSSFEVLRGKLSQNAIILSLIHNGRGVWGSDFGSCSFVIMKKADPLFQGVFKRLFVNQGEVNPNEVLQSRFFDTENFPQYHASLGDFRSIPSAPIAYWISPKIRNIFAKAKKNIYDLTISDGQTVTGDNEKFLRLLWEVSKKDIGTNQKWRIHPKGGAFRRWYGNIDSLINWSEEARIFYRKDRVARILPEYLWNRPGVSWNLVTISEISFRILDEDHIFNKASPSLFFHDISQIPVCLAWLNTKIVAYILKLLNPTVNMNVKEIRSIPYDDKMDVRKTEIANIANRSLAISKEDWDSFETSWGFVVSPLLSRVLC